MNLQDLSIKMIKFNFRELHPDMNSRKGHIRNRKVVILDELFSSTEVSFCFVRLYWLILCFSHTFCK